MPTVAAKAVAAVAVLAGAAPSGAAEALPDFSALDAWIEANPEPFAPSGVGLVIARHGRIIYENTWHGFEDEPRPIASSSKWLSGLILCTLIDQRRPFGPDFELDTPVGAFLPAFAAQPEKAGITMAECFSHTSGIPSEPAYNRDPSLTMAEAVDLIATVDLVTPPGTGIVYGGQGMQVVGRMAELTVGRPWSEFARQRLFDPLGMDRTDYEAFTPPTQVPTANPNVAGSVRTTLSDYARFVTMLSDDGLYRGTRIASSGSIDVLLTDLSADQPVLFSPYLQYERFVPGVGGFHTGFGCFIDPARIERFVAPGRPSPQRNVRWATSAGAFGTNGFIDLDRGIAGVLMTEVSGNDDIGERVTYNPATRAFLESIRPLIEQAVPVLDAAPPFDPDLTRDGALDVFDVLAWFELYSRFDPVTDLDSDRRRTVLDILVYFDAFADAAGG